MTARGWYSLSSRCSSHAAIAKIAIGSAALRMLRVRSFELVDEVVLGALLVARVQLHLTTYGRVLASATGDREHGIALVEERALHGDLSVRSRQRPPALPRSTGDGAHAEPLVGRDLRLVRRVVDRIR